MTRMRPGASSHAGSLPRATSRARRQRRDNALRVAARGVARSAADRPGRATGSAPGAGLAAAARP
eukprot:771804-Lingulodinium_polyedra.AAC.1